MNEKAPAVGLHADARFEQAIALQESGRLGQALQLYHTLLLKFPRDAELLYMVGSAKCQNGEIAAGLDLLDRCLSIDSNFAEAHNNKGLALAHLDRNQDAELAFAAAIRLAPNYLDAHFNRANALRALGRKAEALPCYDAVVTLNAQDFEAHHFKGLVLADLGRLDDALQSFDSAIRLNPDYAPAHFDRAMLLGQLGRQGEAIESFQRVIQLNPHHAEAFVNRGVALASLGRTQEALQSQEQAIRLKPELAAAHNGRGSALFVLQRFEEALQCFDRAINLDPDLADAHANRASALRELKRSKEALDGYDRALRLNPHIATSYYGRGYVLLEFLRIEEARKSFLKAIEIDPDFDLAAWALAFLPIIPVHDDIASVEAARELFVRELGELQKRFPSPIKSSAYRCVGSFMPFYLAYQELNNRDILATYGALCRQIMDGWAAQHGLPLATPVKSGRIRIGIVSEFIYDHPVWQAILKGWLTGIDRSRFDIHVFYLGVKSDPETEFARSASTSFTEGAVTLDDWVTNIRAKELEMLIYSDVGMRPLTSQLASLKLAPYQAVTWGHPETSGLPTVDFFISSSNFESEDSSAFYTERLIKLANLGCRYSRLAVTPVPPDLRKLGLTDDVPILICPGSTFKYGLDQDRVFAEIARRLGQCQLVFFVHDEAWTAVLKRRLARAFAAEGLSFENYVVFIPWLERAEFFGLMTCATAFLDTIGFSGFNTAMQAIECGLPIVTRKGKFMRGRFASSILERIGAAELVADSNADYVELAEKLVTDQAFRDRQLRLIRDNRAVLFDDDEPIVDLQNFLIKTCRG